MMASSHQAVEKPTTKGDAIQSVRTHSNCREWLTGSRRELCAAGESTTVAKLFIFNFGGQNYHYAIFRVNAPRENRRAANEANSQELSILFLTDQQL